MAEEEIGRRDEEFQQQKFRGLSHNLSNAKPYLDR
jgi:hypothetical protein